MYKQVKRPSLGANSCARVLGIGMLISLDVLAGRLKSFLHQLEKITDARVADVRHAGFLPSL
jgi:hypothetical protein